MNSVPWSHSHHIAFTGTSPSPTDLNTFCTHIADTSPHPWQFYLNTFFTSQSVLTSIEAIDLTSSSGAVGAATFTLGGGDTGQPPTNASAVLSNWKIARRYRGGHPRTFWQPFGNAHQLNATSWTAGQAASFAAQLFPFWAAVEALLPSGMVSGGLVNISYFNKAGGGSPPYLRPTPVQDAIIGVLVPQKIATQRRRLG